MAGEEILGHGKIIVEVEQHVAREMAKAEAEFDKGMAALSRKEAELKMRIDSKEFDLQKKEIEAKIKELDKERADATVTLDTKKAESGLTRWRRKLKSLEAEELRLKNQSDKLAEDRAAVEQKFYDKIEAGDRKLNDARRKQANQTAAAIKQAEKEAADASIAASNRRAKEGERIRKADIAKETAQIREAVTRQATEKARADKLAVAQRAATIKAIQAAEAKADKERVAASVKAERDGAKARAETLKHESRRAKVFSDAARLRALEERQIASLVQQYRNLSQARSKLERRQAKVLIPKDERVNIDIDMAVLDEQLLRVREKLDRVGHPPPHIEFDVDQGGSRTLAKWAEALGSTTLRIGPFTTSIAGAVRAMALLGPVIFGVIGAMGSLVGVVGAAAVGFGGALVAGTGAFGLALGSVGLLLPSLLRDFKTLNTLQTAYHKQVLKTGANSDKAKQKLQELNHAVKAAGPGARAAYQGYNKLQDSWRQLAKSVRPDFMNTLTAAFKTGQGAIKQFTPQIQQTFGIVARGAQSMFKSLSGPAATGIFTKLFANANASLPAFGSGLANLAHFAGLVAAAFSDMLPSLGAGFKTWTQGLLGVAQDSGRMTSIVQKTTDAMRNFGHFAQAAGRWLIAFFGQGVGPGIGLLQRMTDGFNNMTDSIHNNPASTGNFFQDAVDTTVKLYNALKPLAQLFFEFATIMRPFTSIFLDVTRAIAGLVKIFAQFAPVRGLLAGAFGIFILGTLAGKIREGVKAVRELRIAMAALGGTKVATSIANALTGGALTNFGLGARRAAQLEKEAVAARGAATATRELSTATKVATGASVALGAEGVVAGGALAGVSVAAGLASLGVGLVAGAAIYGAYKLLTAKSATDKLHDSFKRVGQATAALIPSMQGYGDAVAAAALTQRDSNKNLTSLAKLKERLISLEDHHKKGTQAYADTLNQLNQRLDARTQNETNAQQINDKLIAQRRVLSVADKARKIATDDLATAQKRLNDAQAMPTGGDAGGRGGQEQAERKAKAVAAATKDLALAQMSLTTASRGYTQVLNVINAGEAQRARALAGLRPLVGAAEQALGKLAKVRPNLALKISLKFPDPRDAGRVASSTRRALGAGVSLKTVMKIVADSKGAEQTIRRLQVARLDPKVIHILEMGGAAARKMLETIKGTKLTKKEQHILQRGGDGVRKLLEKIMGITIRKKEFDVVLRGFPEAWSNLSRLNNFKLKPIFQDVWQRLHALAGQPSSPSKGGRKGVGAPEVGGSTGPAGFQRMASAMDFKRAVSSTVQRATGQVVRRPTAFIAGEATNGQSREYVIATNPAYRDRNKGLLAQAAKDLGIDLPAFKFGGLNTGSSGFGYYANTAEIGRNRPADPGTRPKTIKRHAKGFAKRAKKQYKSGRGWVNYIESLSTQQGDLEREINIRESQVKEPSELVKEDGRITDAATGADLGPKLVPNTEAINVYKEGLFAVQEAIRALVAVITELINSIPTAINAINIEDAFRTGNIKNLNDAIHREKTQIKNMEKAKKPDKEAIANIKGKLSRDEKRLAAEHDARDVIRGDRKTLNRDIIDKGFDLREANLRYEASVAEVTGIDGKAQTEADSQNANPAGGTGAGAGAGASGDLTYGQQQALSDAERAGIMRDYGSNVLSLAGGTPNAQSPSSSGWGQGMQLNPAAIGQALIGGMAGGGTPHGPTTKPPGPYRGGIVPSALTDMLSSSGAAASIGAGLLGGGVAGAPTARMAGQGAGTTVNNYFKTQPSDPLTWSKGIAFELGAL